MAFATFVLGAIIVVAAFGMLGIMVSGYLIMTALFAMAFFGAGMYFFKTLISAYFDETVDPLHLFGVAQVDIAFIEKEIDLRLIEVEHLDPAHTISYVPNHTEKRTEIGILPVAS